MSSIEKDELAEDLKVNSELINRIKETQDLPEEIIINFINASGSLALTEYGNSYLNE